MQINLADESFKYDETRNPNLIAKRNLFVLNNVFDWRVHVSNLPSLEKQITPLERIIGKTVRTVLSDLFILHAENYLKWF